MFIGRYIAVTTGEKMQKARLERYNTKVLPTVGWGHKKEIKKIFPFFTLRDGPTGNRTGPMFIYSYCRHSY